MHIAPNNKRYIGITKQNPIKRWLYGKGYQKQDYFYNAILKYRMEKHRTQNTIFKFNSRTGRTKRGRINSFL